MTSCKEEMQIICVEIDFGGYLVYVLYFIDKKKGCRNIDQISYDHPILPGRNFVSWGIHA